MTALPFGAATVCGVDAPSSFEFVLFPGRHHIWTRFQPRYLRRLLAGEESSLSGGKLRFSPSAQVVVAVTSSDHDTTRRNPIPYARREAIATAVGLAHDLPLLVYPVPDTRPTDRFASYTLATVSAALGRELTPENTVVACSTPEVIALYRRLGFEIAPVELLVSGDDEGRRFAYTLPFQLVTRIAAAYPHTAALEDAYAAADPAARLIWERYGLDAHTHTIFSDPLLTAEGDLTETRNYTPYVASQDTGAARKWALLAPHVRPGRVVDIGAGAGSLLAEAAADPALADSDLYGIEIARPLYETCLHRRSLGHFRNPNTFFYRANILTGPLFPAGSVDTTLTVSLTHEIDSYGVSGDLERLAKAIFDHTRPGGVWLNLDVVGPEDPDRRVRLYLNDRPTAERTVRWADWEPSMAADPASAPAVLARLTPAARFRCFARDFRAGYRDAGVPFEVVAPAVVDLPMRYAAEFLAHWEYIDSWHSECKERFAYHTPADLIRLAADAGFVVDSASGPFRNPWVVENRFAAAARLTDTADRPLPWPPTNILVVAHRL